MTIDSKSVGDPARFLSLEILNAQFDALTPAPRDRGSAVMLVTRVEGGRRELLETARLTVSGGIPGDAWNRQAAPVPDEQIAVMQASVAKLIANGQPLTLFGDGLFLDLDLSAENLPIGSQVRLGSALLEVTPTPHNGCSKFRARFGEGALRFTAQPKLRHRNLRGIYLRVVSDGDVRPGDVAEVLSRQGV